MTATVTNNISEQEYFQPEEKSHVHHEFINGEIDEIPGGTLSHEQVIANIQFQLKLIGSKAFV